MVLKKEYLKTSLDVRSSLIYKHISGLSRKRHDSSSFPPPDWNVGKALVVKSEADYPFLPDADALSILWAR